ncbi:hypothetical protein [Verrucomicrobium spinosum]|uniref:hypothetical protein n=1 Tax=Verrucomicrobium spinosum TaxID=2736 RepID=UPI0001745944|nr:hypothetical protein [Verrucomicrobium spinosum]
MSLKISSPGVILLFKGRGIVSGLIRLQTRSVYSHAALLYPDTHTLIESWQGAGVRKKTITDWEGVDAFIVPGMTEAQWRDAFRFAEAQIGMGYDYRSVARFVSRVSARENERWFCSELVFAALHHAGVDLLARIPAAEVAPGHLAWSTLMQPVQLSTI